MEGTSEYGRAPSDEQTITWAMGFLAGFSRGRNTNVPKPTLSAARKEALRTLDGREASRIATEGPQDGR